MKRKTVSLDTIAKMYTNPEQFKKELVELSAKLKVFGLKYGDIGLQALSKMTIL